MEEEEVSMPPPPPEPAAGVDWQERCVHLEEALHRFRDQTARIRSLLREKLAELDRRVTEAEQRAEQAESRARDLEELISHNDKERLIKELRDQLKEQKDLRAEEARHIETKAMQIKEWVTAKLRDLEEENQRLREQNERWKEQMEFLRRRLCVTREEVGTGGKHASDTRSLDRQLRPRRPDLPRQRRRWSIRDDTTHDYAEIYTPSQEVEPPTPPLHRFPSWESRIYEVAVSGISASCDSLKTDASESRADPTPQQLSIPVYATVHGRASQIRCMLGESTDSSDNEAGGGGDMEGSPGRSAGLMRGANSVDSDLSDDYAVPPDARSLDGQSYREGQSTIDRKEATLEKCGYLTKLGGKFKTWRRRWFVLRDGNLHYYKSQHDMYRKPQGRIALDETCRISRADGAASTFEICTAKRTYYLTADSVETMESWIKVLQNVLKRKATWLLLSRNDLKPAISGWLTKVKHGHSRRCWCVLFGRIFLYFKSPQDTIPLGQINMRDARVQEVAHMSDSDQDGENGPSSGGNTATDFTLAIFPRRQGPTYLLCSTSQEMEAWLYHLTVVSSGDTLGGSQHEQLVARLMEAEGNEGSVLWRHPTLLYTKETLTAPLTTLNSELLQNEARKLFKSIQLFISVPIAPSGIDYHVALTQHALQQCLTHPELQNELFCQLVKQTSRHPSPKMGVQHLLLCATQSLFLCDGADKTSPTTPGGGPGGGQGLQEDSKLNPPPFVFVQGWQLLALACSLFAPRSRTLWLLNTHLRKNAEPRLEVGKYAMFCQRALSRVASNGPRVAKPSRMEVLSILLKNPYHHSMPHSIPVHFLNGTYQVVGFDGSTTVKEFVDRLNAEIGIQDPSQSGFALFKDDPIDKTLEHCIPLSDKICDVLSLWEQALRENQRGKFESSRVIKLTYKNRMYFRHAGSRNETEKERLLLTYQINQDMVEGRFPLTRELALEMAGLMLQIEFGDITQERPRTSMYNPDKCLQDALHRFFPKRYQDGPQGPLLNCIREKWQALRGKSSQDCVRIFLNCARKWTYCSAKLFSAKTKSGENVWLAVSDDSVSVLEASTMQAMAKYPYASLLTFGGCKDDFMLVVAPPGESSRSMAAERVLFSMPKPKVLEATLLVADYMNAHLRPHRPPSSLDRGQHHRGPRHEVLRTRAASVDLIAGR